ncbi:hypothetical protein CN345_01805 [Bacillus thuringiensis]|nr:hypothetical protein CN345_01805 [Bacillus thuringiensis]PGY51238.1 hypothetical protein COE09_17985 [Bacillus thuringiensis]
MHYFGSDVYYCVFSSNHRDVFVPLKRRNFCSIYSNHALSAWLCFYENMGKTLWGTIGFEGG